MIGRMRAAWVMMIVCGWCLLVGCGDDCATDPPPPIRECVGHVTVSVSDGTTPTFSWTPDCTLGRLIVEAGPQEEYWGTETLGFNIYRSPVVYGVHPPGASEQQVAQPLDRGVTYTVSVFRWPSSHPDSLDTGFQLIGSKQFTP